MTLTEIKRLIRRRKYLYSQKIRNLIEDGFFEEADMEQCILSATRIYKKERDELGQAVDGMKYVILGKDTYGRPFYTAGKVLSDADGRIYFYITAHQGD
jgi:hypothetical protein